MWITEKRQVYSDCETIKIFRQIINSLLRCGLNDSHVSLPDDRISHVRTERWLGESGRRQNKKNAACQLAVSGVLYYSR